MWDVVRSNFVELVLSFFSSGSLDKSLSMTWVTLIPKVDGAKEMKDFRPITMVGCVYKVISKILVRRLKGVMNNLVGEAQAAFIHDRKFFYGALIY